MASEAAKGHVSLHRIPASLGVSAYAGLRFGALYLLTHLPDIYNGYGPYMHPLQPSGLMAPWVQIRWAFDVLLFSVAAMTLLSGIAMALGTLIAHMVPGVLGGRDLEYFPRLSRIKRCWRNRRARRMLVALAVAAALFWLLLTPRDWISHSYYLYNSTMLFASLAALWCCIVLWQVDWMLRLNRPAVPIGLVLIVIGMIDIVRVLQQNDVMVVWGWVI